MKLIENEKEKVIRIHQFVLNNNSDNIRDSLYEDIIARAVYEHGDNNNSLDKEKIFQKMEVDYGVVGFHPSIIDSAIKRLKMNGSITVEDNKIKLSDTKQKEIKKNNQEFIAFFEKIKNDLQNKIRIQLGISKEKAEDITKDFFKIIGKSFSEDGKLSSKVIADGKNHTEIFSGDEFKTDYTTKILTKINPDQHEKLDEVFLDFFSGEDEQKNKFFFTLTQSYALLQILNIDPELKKIQERSLSEKKIYLDTNLLIDLIFEESEKHLPIKNVISITRELGAELLITNLTKREFEIWLKNCLISYTNFKKIPEKFIEAFKNKDTSAPFFDTYQKKILENPRLTISQFCKYYENYLILIDKQYNIKVDDDDIEQFKESPQYEPLFQKLSIIKYPNVAKHDALCILKIKQLRQDTPGNILGLSAWLITTDTSLKKMEKRVFPDEEFTASILHRVWLQVISPLLSPKLRDKNDVTRAFTKLLGTNFSSANTITEEDVLNTLSAFIDDASITVDTLEEIIGNTHLRDTFRKISRAHQENNLEEEEKWKKVGYSQITNTLQKKHKKETIDMKAALQNLTKSLDQTKTEMQNQSNVLKEQSEILKSQTREIINLKHEKNEKNWGKKFFKKLAIGIIIASVTIGVLVFTNVISDMSSILGVVGIAATILGTTFGVWFGVHKSRTENISQ